MPAIALWSLVCGLLVKAGNIGKLPSAEPLFAGLFARLLAEVHPPLADCLAVVWWKGGDEEQASALYAEADTVLAYGGNDALDADPAPAAGHDALPGLRSQAGLRPGQRLGPRRPESAGDGTPGRLGRDAL